MSNLIARLKNRVTSALSPTKRGILLLSSGTLLSQLVLIGSSLLFARLYSPAEFGVFAIFGSVGAIGSVLVGARYEVAIVIPETEHEALAVFKIAVGLSSMLCGSVALVVTPLALILGSGDLVLFALLAPLNVWLMHAVISVNLWLNRKRQYRNLAILAVAQAVGIGSIGVVLGLRSFGLAGLMISATAGRTFALMFAVLVGFAPSERRKVRSLTKADVQPLATRFRNHPRHLLGSAMIGTVALQMPVFLLSSAFGASATGNYAMANRFITLPATMGARALGEVYRERISVRLRKTGEFVDLFKRTARVAALGSIVPFTLMYVLAPQIYRLAFGPGWDDAATFARILIVAAYFRFVLVPVDKGAIVVGATRYVFSWQLGRLVVALGLFAVVHVSEMGVTLALWLITISTALLHVINGFANYHFSKGTQTAS